MIRKYAYFFAGLLVVFITIGVGFYMAYATVDNFKMIEER